MKQDRLVCVVLVAGQVCAVLSRKRRPAGRGGWLCPAVACVRAAVDTRAFSRAFRSSVRAPDADELVAAVVRNAAA